jgi:hypothetical protein
MTHNGTSSRYSIQLVRVNDGTRFARRAVPESYLEAAREQVIFHNQRRGVLGADPSGIRVRDTPVFAAEGSDEVQGVEMIPAGGGCDDRLSVYFGTGLFQPFGQRAALDLIEARQAVASDDIRIRVFAADYVAPAEATERKGAVVREPLPLLDGNIDRVLSQSVSMGPVDDRDYPVFVTAAALEQAHEFVWQRNRESGVWLIGNLYRQRAPHEIFAIAHTVFEAQGTTHDRFSIDFSTETYTHVQRQLQVSRTRFGRSADVLLGFHHTHPFLPSLLDGMEACPTCSLRPTCKLTSSFFSQRDQAFHAAMFGSAAYAVEIVLGLTPREEFDLKMFCCDGGQFRERGFYRLAELPADAPSNGVTAR